MVRVPYTSIGYMEVAVTVYLLYMPHCQSPSNTVKTVHEWDVSESMKLANCLQIVLQFYANIVWPVSTGPKIPASSRAAKRLNNIRS